VVSGVTTECATCAVHRGPRLQGVSLAEVEEFLGVGLTGLAQFPETTYYATSFGHSYSLAIAFRCVQLVCREVWQLRA
jgi:hypothetical protein